MMKRGLVTIQIRHPILHRFGEQIFISKINLVDNNKRINGAVVFFEK